MSSKTLTATIPFAIAAACGLALYAMPPARADNSIPAMRVSISTEKADVRTVLSDLFRKAGANFILDSAVKGEVDVDVKSMPFTDALRAVLDAVHDGPALDYASESGIFRVMPRKTSTEKKDIADVPVERESHSRSVLEPRADQSGVPPTERYVIPTPPVAVGRGIRPGLVESDGLAYYVRVDQVPADPMWLPVGAALPAVPVWTGATRPSVQAELGPRPPDAIGGGVILQSGVGLGVTASSHLPVVPGARFRSGSRFPSWR